MSNGRILVDALEAARAPGRRRFTIAHELAHLVLHDDHVEPRLRRPVSRESAARIAPTADLGCPAALAYPPQELEANQFAAAMLMPADHLAAAGIECPLELADLCRVSLAAAEKRLDYLRWRRSRPCGDDPFVGRTPAKGPAQHPATGRAVAPASETRAQAVPVGTAHSVARR